MEKTMRTRKLSTLPRLGIAAVVLLTMAACGQFVPPINPDTGNLTVSAMAPTVGNTGNAVTITGTNIAGNAVVTVGGEQATNVVVRDLLGQVVTGDAKTGITARFNPPQLEDGQYEVMVSQGTGADAQEVSAGTFTFDSTVDPDPDPTPDGDVLRVNAGGPAVEHGGVTWVADTQYVQSQGAAFTNAIPIAGTTNATIYQTERNTGGNAQGNVITYAVPLDNGTYEVTLHFAEIYFGAPTNPAANAGQRVFNVELQNQTVLSNYDIFVAANNAAATAVTETFTVEVTNGVLNIRISNVTDRGKISAFEIAPVNGNGNGDGNGAI
jgi:hypothetical protein